MTANPVPLADKVAIVTGASSGLGCATALRLSRAGASVALLARSAADLASVEQRITRGGGHALPLATDLSDPDAATSAVARTADAFGRVDILVNAAATDVPGSVEALTVRDWDHVVAVNLRAPFVLSKAVFPLMRAEGGTIINVSSVAGLRGWANATAYCSTKFALTGFTQALAAEGRPFGIRACVLYPGAMATSWGVWSSEDRESVDAEASVPSGDNSLPPDQVADLIVWIAAAPRGLVLPQVTVTPLLEQGWP